MNGISGAGQSVEDRFRALTHSKRPAKKGDGDAVVSGVAVEVKKASADTLNQVRAVKYITLVCYDERDGSWYVVPAHQVVKLVSEKVRGQHTENPFESATISVRALGDFRVVREQDLLTRVEAAIRAADEFPRVKESMKNVLNKSKALANESRDEVGRILRESGLLG